MSASLVGSEMCIRDSVLRSLPAKAPKGQRRRRPSPPLGQTGSRDPGDPCGDRANGAEADEGRPQGGVDDALLAEWDAAAAAAAADVALPSEQEALS
eukprot:12686031-Alexandrium_andersonii.AAC.1